MKVGEWTVEDITGEHVSGILEGFREAFATQADKAHADGEPDLHRYACHMSNAFAKLRNAWDAGKIK